MKIVKKLRSRYENLLISNGSHSSRHMEGVHYKIMGELNYKQAETV